MARRAFYSFHYALDNWRASTVRGIGAIEANQPASDNDWEAVKRGGDPAIERWIAGQMAGRSCIVVLIGSQTASRPWVNYEIDKAWKDKKGVLGIYIHNLLDRNQQRTVKGANPFANHVINGLSLASNVQAIDPPYSDSKAVYGHIASNLALWIDAAIAIRNRFS